MPFIRNGSDSILDTGSYRVLDPYEEIAKSIKHTVNWQIKEAVFLNGQEIPTDLGKLLGLIKSAGYRGYSPHRNPRQRRPKNKSHHPTRRPATVNGLKRNPVFPLSASRSKAGMVIQTIAIVLSKILNVASGSASTLLIRAKIFNA